MKYGAENVFKPLRAVLVARPINYGIDTPINMWQEKNVGQINQRLAIEQHDTMVDMLESLGVRCYYLDSIVGATEQKDTRDLGVITKHGAIAGHFKKDIRLGEVASFIKFCAERGIKILKYGIPFEGGDFFFLDEQHCLVGIGQRTEMRANEIESLLHCEVQLVHHVSSHHLDALFNVISPNLVVAHTQSFAEQSFLQDKEVIPMTDDDVWNMCSNFLVLEANKIVADIACHEFNEKLRAKGVEVIELDLSELKKNGGSIRCMTLPVLRG